MKLLPLIGALLLSTAPVKANETLEKKFMELVELCYISQDVMYACSISGTFQSMFTGCRLICNSWDDEEITEVGFIKSVARLRERLRERVSEDEKLAWNRAVRDILSYHPNCPIRPIP